jgi:hypothetical protein
MKKGPPGFGAHTCILPYSNHADHFGKIPKMGANATEFQRDFLILFEFQLE